MNHAEAEARSTAAEAPRAGSGSSSAEMADAAEVSSAYLVRCSEQVEGQLHVVSSKKPMTCLRLSRLFEIL